uniref:Uncharacterized protein n=1 Tax=Cymathaere triplicata TaxID=309354 RepID=A0A8F0JZS9_9PHAE|nr:hypothetical protein [Cymathaere triplicata]
MVKAKRYSASDLTDFYAVSPVFKKYSQYNLWSENFSEYHNIKYCEIYLSQFFFSRTQKYILEHFSESFLWTLHNSQIFLKFVHSGFFRYINYKFLFLLKRNKLVFFSDSYEEVEIFVEKYFERYIQKKFEQDLLICLVTCINEIGLKSFEGYLNNYLKFVHKELLLIESITALSSNDAVIRNSTEINKRRHNHLGFVDYKVTTQIYNFDRAKAHIPIKREGSCFFITCYIYKNYKSLKLNKEVSGILTSNFLSLFLVDTTYNWEHFAASHYKKVPQQTRSYFLCCSYKASTAYRYLTSNKKASSLKTYYFLLPICSWCFYTSPDYVSKLSNKLTFNSTTKSSRAYNYNFQVLLGSFQIFVSFDKRINDIGIYRESINVFLEDIKPIYLELVNTAVRGLLKCFECIFNKTSTYVNLEVGFVSLAEFDVILLIYRKKVFEKLDPQKKIISKLF